MKTVAIYGFAPQTRDLIEHSTADEVWSLNNFYNYGLPEERVTRTFEMHALWMMHPKEGYTNAEFYWDWLKEEHPFHIYVPKVRQDFVNDFYRIKHTFENGYADLEDVEKLILGEDLREVEIGLEFFADNKSDIRRYPLEDIIDDTIPILDCVNTDIFPERGMNPFYISTIDYMSALAIYEGFDRIEYYGVELREKTEWAMQKSGATFWAGFARGRGIEVLTPRDSVLISAPLYGLKGGDQLIPIQVPEQIKKELVTAFDEHRNVHNHLTGQFSVVKEIRDQFLLEGETKIADKLTEKLNELRNPIEKALISMYMAEGGLNLCNYLIDHENMKLQPPSVMLESITRLEEVVLEDGKGKYNK